MMKPWGRIALLASVSAAMICGLASCASSTLGYLYVTTGEYGQVASLRLDINTGQIKSVNCNTGNGDQSNCITSSGGPYATKIALASSDSLAFVLNTNYKNGSNYATCPNNATACPSTIALFTLGSGGSIYSTGQTTQSFGQNAVDMYLSPTGNFLYVLDQYQPADVPGCASPTPATCKGDITVFAIDGKGDLTPVACGTGDGCITGGSTNDQYVFPINYEPGPLNAGYGGSRMLAINNAFFVLDESTPDTSTGLGTPEVHFFTIASSGALQPTSPVAVSVPGSEQLSSIFAGSHIYISDYKTGQVWVYQTSAGSGLTQLSVVCPAAGTISNPSFSQCTTNPTAPASNNAVQLDAMIASGTYLYIADYNTQTIYTMQDTGSGTYLTPTGDGATTLGTNTTCLTLSSSPEFLYASGSGTVVGEQVNTSNGALSTNLNPTAGVPFTGVVPCLQFSPRT